MASPEVNGESPGPAKPGGKTPGGKWQLPRVIMYAVARVQVANVLEPTQQTLENPKMW